jgi:hypothetical protein
MSEIDSGDAILQETVIRFSTTQISWVSLSGAWNSINHHLVRKEREQMETSSSRYSVTLKAIARERNRSPAQRKSAMETKREQKHWRHKRALSSVEKKRSEL